MDWKTLEGYDEKYAKITVKPHKVFDGKVVEVLYGAKDEQGQPVLAVEGHNDGHGRWYGIETDGKYTMFVWQKPAYLGGEIVYGSDFKEDAVEELEKDIRHKYELCRKLDTFNESTTNEQIEQIKQDFANITNWQTAKEEEYNDWFTKGLAKVALRKEKAVKNAAEKEELVTKAKALETSTSWRETQEAFHHLQDHWQEIGHAGEKENELWNAFKQARKEFNKKRKEYFADLDTIHAQIKDKKEELIKEVQEVLTDSNNFNSLSVKMEKWMADWKALGSAGRDEDDKLWEVFNGLRQKFYTARKEFFKQRNEEFASSIEKKKELITKAKEIVDSGDLGKENTEKMKSFDVEWKAAGYSGRKENDRIWETFKEIKEQFWAAKHKANQDRFQEILNHKEQLVETLRKEINALQENIFEVDDYEDIHDMERQIDRKKTMVTQINADIDDLKKKIA